MATRDVWRSTRATADRTPKPQFLLHHGRQLRRLPLEPSPLVPRGGRLRAYRLLWSIAKQFQASRRRRHSLLKLIFSTPATRDLRECGTIHVGSFIWLKLPSS